MRKIAFVTYNSVGNNLLSGWHDGPNGRQALVLQNTNGDGGINSGPIGANQRRDQASILWGQLQKDVAELDHVVVYVGTNGSERAIALAGQLPASKVTFVGCDCGLPEKEIMIRATGLTNARRVLCECGGHRTMKVLFESFMQSGELLPAAA